MIQKDTCTPMFMQTAYNSQEVTSMSINRGMGGKDVLHIHSGLLLSHGLPRRLSVKEPSCYVGNAGDTDSISKSGRSPGAGNGNLLQILACKIPWTEEAGEL